MSGSDQRQAIAPNEPGDDLIPASDTVWWIAFRGHPSFDADCEKLHAASKEFLSAVQAGMLAPHTDCGDPAKRRPFPSHKFDGAIATAPTCECGIDQINTDRPAKRIAGIRFRGPSLVTGEPLFGDDLKLNGPGGHPATWAAIGVEKATVLQLWPALPPASIGRPVTRTDARWPLDLACCLAVAPDTFDRWQAGETNAAAMAASRGNDGLDALLDELRAGRISSTGLIDGRRAAIEPFLWEDFRLSRSPLPRPVQVTSCAGKPPTDVRVDRVRMDRWLNMDDAAATPQPTVKKPAAKAEADAEFIEAHAQLVAVCRRRFGEGPHPPLRKQAETLMKDPAAAAVLRRLDCASIDSLRQLLSGSHRRIKDLAARHLMAATSWDLQQQ